jgi:hypothetical protein
MRNERENSLTGREESETGLACYVKPLDITPIMRIERKGVESRLNRLLTRYTGFFSLFNREFRKTKRLPERDSVLLDDIHVSLEALSNYCRDYRLPSFNSCVVELKFKLHDFYKHLGYGKKKEKIP